jgi:DNA-binding MarR family transcriptional regulator
MAMIRVVELIKRAERALHFRLNGELREFGLSVTEYGILDSVSRRGAISAADVARVVTVTPQALTRLVGKLEQRGLIDRSSTEGSRTLRITLTPAGEELYRAATDVVDRIEAIVVAALDEAGPSAVDGALWNVIAALDAISYARLASLADSGEFSARAGHPARSGPVRDGPLPLAAGGVGGLKPVPRAGADRPINPGASWAGVHPAQ